jgi:hypothetical protein
MQILLVIVLGIVERFRGGDFRRHLARIAASRMACWKRSRLARAAASCSGVSG